MRGWIGVSAAKAAGVRSFFSFSLARVGSVPVLALGLFLALALGGIALGQLAPSATRAMGEPANDYPAGEACASRIAINVTFGHVCTDVCETDADCPANWGCKGIEEGAGSVAWLCFPRRVAVTE